MRFLAGDLRWVDPHLPHFPEGGLVVLRINCVGKQEFRLALGTVNFDGNCNRRADQDSVQTFFGHHQAAFLNAELTAQTEQYAKNLKFSRARTTSSIDHLGIKLMTRRTGGPDGGGSVLTEDGHRLMERFRAFLDEADADLARLYQKYFGDTSFAQPEDALPPAPGQDES